MIVGKGRGAICDLKVEGFIRKPNYSFIPYFCYREIVWIGLLNHESEYANHFFFEVSKQFNQQIPIQILNRYSDNQNEVYKIIKSLHDNGIGYRRISKTLNNRGISME